MREHRLHLSVRLAALALVVLRVGIAAAQSGESPLVVKVTTERRVYRAGRMIRITLTETNTSDHPVQVLTGCQILHGRVTAEDGSTVAVCRDQRLCVTMTGTLAAGARRTLEFAWEGRVYRGDLAAPTLAPPGRYTITAGVDGVEGSTVVRVRRRRK
jgi:hypothetical protein